MRRARSARSAARPTVLGWCAAVAVAGLLTAATAGAAGAAGARPAVAPMVSGTPAGAAVRAGATSGAPLPVSAALPVGAALQTQGALVTATGYRLVMQADGNLVESGLGRVLWSSRTHVAGSDAVMQADGNFVIYSPTGVPEWYTNTSGRASAGVLLDADGDLLMDSTSGTLLWDNQVESYTLAPTGRLTSTQVIDSPSGNTRVAMQADGNVVLETLVGTAWVVVWASNTSGHPGSFLRMRADGNLVVLDPANAILWSTATQTPGPVHLSVQDGGNARILDPAGDLVASVGDDYPANLRAAAQDSLVDPWGYYNRECVSFAAWRALEEDHVAVLYAGSAYRWAGYAKRHGYLVDTNPTPGSIAWTNAGTFGHVAMVEKVLGAFLVVEEYNYLTPGVYSHRVVLASAFKKFLHFELPAASSPAQGARAGGLSATVGPGLAAGGAAG